MIKFRKDLLFLKAHYVLYSAGMGPMLPFIPPILRNMGLSDNIIGIIFLCLPICGMIAKTWFGALADKYNKQRFFFLVFLALTFLTELGMVLMPSTLAKPSVQLECSSVGTNFSFCSSNRIAKNEKNTFLEQNQANIKCQLDCHDERNTLNFASELCNSWGVKEFCSSQNFSAKESQLNVVKPVSFQFSTFISTTDNFEMNNCLCFNLNRAVFKNEETSSLRCSTYKAGFCDVECDNAAFNEMWVQTEASTARVKDRDAFLLPQFWLLFLVLIIYWSSVAVVIIIADTICFNLLAGKPEEFGRQRLWASLGWGISSLLSGNLTDYFNKGKTFMNYRPLLYISLFMIFLDFPFAFKIKHTQAKISTNILKDVGKLLRRPQILVFIIWCITIGFFTALIWNFLFLHLEDLANAREEKDQWIKSLQGLVVAIQCLGGEVPFLFLSGLIIKKLGHTNTMSLILLAFGFRFTLISFIHNPWYILPIEVLSGLTYGLLTCTMNSYASFIAPPGADATMQGLVGSVFEGLGVSVGSYVCGALFDAYSGQTTFRIFAFSAFFTFAAHVLVQIIIQLFTDSESVELSSASKFKDLPPGLIMMEVEKKRGEEKKC